MMGDSRIPITVSQDSSGMPFLSQEANIKVKHSTVLWDGYVLSSETGISSWIPNVFHLLKIFTPTWFRRSDSVTGLDNTAHF